MRYNFYEKMDALHYQYSRLPSGFGTVRFLGYGRANPYAVHPPAIITPECKQKRPPAICYVPDKTTGFKILALYHEGMYTPRLERDALAIERLYRSLIAKHSDETYANQDAPSSGLSRHTVDHTDSWNQSENNQPPVEKNEFGKDCLSCTEEGKSFLNNYIDASCNHVFTDFPLPKESGDRILQFLYSQYRQVFGESGLTCEFPHADLQPFLRFLYSQNGQAFLEAEPMHEFPQAELQPFLQFLYSQYNQAVQQSEATCESLQPKSQPLMHSTAVLQPSDSGSPHTGERDSAPHLKQVYTEFVRFKYGRHAAKKLSGSSRNASNAAYLKLEPFYERSLDDIRIGELQNLVNSVAAKGYSRSAVTDLVTLIRQIYRFAYPREMCTKEYGKYVLMPYTAEEKHHQDFNDTELQILWNHQDDPVVSMILIMCYSGFRISEFAPENKIQTVLCKDGNISYFRGGIKTKAGRDRIVPIHSAIVPLIEQILDGNGKPVYLCGKSTCRFRTEMKHLLAEIGIDTVPQTIITDESALNCRYHTPHSCRHTFSRLCESYGVNEADRRRMLGHSFGNDVTNGVYGHRSVGELSAELEKIKLPCFDAPQN